MRGRTAGRRRYTTPRPQKLLGQGPWRGCRDSLDPTSSDPELASLLYNLWIGEAPGDGAWGRPGIQPLGANFGLNLRVQGLRDFVLPDGSRVLVAVCGGLIYRYDWTTDTWSNVAIGAGLALDAAASRVWMRAFAGVLVFSDGTHRPFTWDGAAAWEDLTNCPVLYGPPTVYYAKLFGIKATERNAIVWSEENQPNVGYEATIGPKTYLNVWALKQTRSDALTAIHGTEGALLYWRSGSSGMISGAVTEEFQTTGVHDALSSSIGTLSPDSIVEVGPRLFLLDSLGRPQVIEGGAYREFGPWRDCWETVKGIPQAKLPTAQGTLVEALGVVLFTVADPYVGNPDLMLTFNSTTGQYMGRWGGWTPACFCEAVSPDNDRVLVLGDTLGNVYRQGLPGEGWLNDELRAGEQAIVHIVQASPMGWDTWIEKHFSRVDASVRFSSDLTGIRVSYTTPSTNSQELTIAGSAAAGLAQWDEAEWDVADWPAASLEGKIVAGISTDGRWIAPTITHQGLGQDFGILALSVLAHLGGPDPNLR